ncbi:MAG: MBL fold metallo-hydrolase [Chloroflexi bacterium]|nr:MBL fold metallo-hydrolase [Chloroflexota bacterium]
METVSITCVVENTALRGLKAEHGAAFLVRAGEQQVLLDTGASGVALLHNLQALGAHPNQVDAVVLSHSHPDHAGGLASLMGHLRRRIPLFAHPAIFNERFSKGEEGYAPRGMALPRERLEEWFDLQLSDQPMAVAPSVHTTGEITSRPFLEGRSPHHYVRAERRYRPDPYQDDLSLVLETGSGMFVVCGCCHAGLTNTLAQVAEQHPDRPICGVAGGTHLLETSGEALRQVGDFLAQLPEVQLWLNHCTGSAALAYLQKRFGQAAHPLPAGASVIL